MNQLQKFVSIALPCLTFSPRLAVEDIAPDQLKVEVSTLIRGVKEGSTPEFEKLAHEYFYYADWFCSRGGLGFNKPLEYFLKLHNNNLSSNVSAIGEAGKECMVGLVELISTKTLTVRDVITGKTFQASLYFTVGEALKKHLNELEQIVIMSDNPEIVIMDDERRKKAAQKLDMMRFRFGPLVDLNSKYYLTHWGVLAYALTTDEYKKAIELLKQ